MDNISGKTAEMFFKRYLLHFIIFLISLIVFSFTYYFFIDGTVKANAEIYRYNNTSCREVAFATVDPKSGGDSFYVLNGKVATFINGKRIFCDTYMVKENTSYNGSAILFSGELEENTCLISKNSLNEYGVKIGDVISCGSEVEYTVVGYLTAQVGFDTNYMYDGVILLAYNSDLANIDGVYYANMTSSLNTYYGYLRSTFLINLKKDATKSLITSTVFSAVIFLLCFAVSEYFLFSPRYTDYRIMNDEGLPAIKLFARIFADNLLKYCLPILFISLFFMPKYFCFGSFYLIPTAIYLGYAIIVSLIYSYFLLRRITKCYKIKAC